MKKTNNKGFSLVELIIVIAIMAVLIGVLAPQFIKYVERSRKSTDVQNASEICTVLTTYASDPMVAAADALSNGATVTLSTSADPVCTGNADKALTDGGVSKVKLKSSKWGDGSASSVKITVAIASNGAVTFTADTDGKENDILKGTYK